MACPSDLRRSPVCVVLYVTYKVGSARDNDERKADYVPILIQKNNLLRSAPPKIATVFPNSLPRKVLRNLHRSHTIIPVVDRNAWPVLFNPSRIKGATAACRKFGMPLHHYHTCIKWQN